MKLAEPWLGLEGTTFIANRKCVGVLFTVIHHKKKKKDRILNTQIFSLCIVYSTQIDRDAYFTGIKLEVSVHLYWIVNKKKCDKPVVDKLNKNS
jgi:hypothetical protein